MRKSTGLVMGIIVLAFGGMMVAANVALKPLQRYASIGKELTQVLGNLDMVEPQSRVFVLGRAGGENRLAEAGWGLLIEMEPSQSVRTTAGRLSRLAYRAVDEANSLYQRERGKKLDWFEVKFVLPGDQVHRSLIPIDEARRLGRPEPPFPKTAP